MIRRNGDLHQRQNVLRDQCVSLDVDSSTAVPILRRRRFNRFENKQSRIIDQNVGLRAELSGTCSIPEREKYLYDHRAELQSSISVD